MEGIRCYFISVAAAERHPDGDADADTEARHPRPAILLPDWPQRFPWSAMHGGGREAARNEGRDEREGRKNGKEREGDRETEKEALRS